MVHWLQIKCYNVLLCFCGLFFFFCWGPSETPTRPLKGPYASLCEPLLWTRRGSNKMLKHLQPAAAAWHANNVTVNILKKDNILPLTSLLMQGKSPSSGRRPAQQVYTCKDKNINVMKMKANFTHQRRREFWKRYYIIAIKKMPFQWMLCSIRL